MAFARLLPYFPGTLQVAAAVDLSAYAAATARTTRCGDLAGQYGSQRHACTGKQEAAVCHGFTCPG